MSRACEVVTLPDDASERKDACVSERNAWQEEHYRVYGNE